MGRISNMAAKLSQEEEDFRLYCREIANELMRNKERYPVFHELFDLMKWNEITPGIIVGLSGMCLVFFHQNIVPRVAAEEIEHTIKLGKEDAMLGYLEDNLRDDEVKH